MKLRGGEGCFTQKLEEGAVSDGGASAVAVLLPEFGSLGWITNSRTGAAETRGECRTECRPCSVPPPPNQWVAPCCR